jgi:hypothetical protein
MHPINPKAQLFAPESPTKATRRCLKQIILRREAIRLGRIGWIADMAVVETAFADAA